MNTLDKIAIIRKEKGISQKEMAKRLGISKGGMNNYETGKRDIPFSKLEKYVDELGYEIKLMLK